MFENGVFSKLVADGQPTGEVISVNRMLARVKGLEGASLNSIILFENGDRGLVRSIEDQFVVVLTLSSRETHIGLLAVLEDEVYKVPVGEALIGRVVNVLGMPLDGKGPIQTTAHGPVFTTAPGIVERKSLETQLVTGVSIVDSLFPFVQGQRMAILGDSKLGKSTFLRQLTMHNAATTKSTIVYVLIAKRQVDIDTLVADLTAADALKHTIIVVSSSFDPLVLSYLAPYVGCAMGEYLWQNGRDTIMIYDDLSNHAKVHRELSLLAEVSPGRDSYPGDMFFAHSSLLERAGRLKSNGATQTALPAVLTPNDDITAYLSTNVMSITDGQLIFDLQSFRKGIRPAVNVGLSVSRVGGSVQSIPWKNLSTALFKKLADYRQAAEFAQFGSELSDEAQADLALGKLIYEIYKQPASEMYDVMSQFLMLGAAIRSGGRVQLNVSLLKEQARKSAPGLNFETDLTQKIDELLQVTSINQTTAPSPTPAAKQEVST